MMALSHRLSFALRSAIGAFALIAIVLPARAQAALPSPVALVIGNDRYTNLGAESQLLRARNDAQAVAAALQKVGFHVVLRLDASQAEMQAGVDEAVADVTPGASALVYYAGHGIEIDGANYLIPSDAPAPTGDPGALTGRAIPLAHILNALQAAGARTNFIILDACRANPYGLQTRGQHGGRGLAREAPSEAGFFMIYSAGINQTALDSLSQSDPNPNSVFTRVFLRYLQRTDLPLTTIAKALQRDVSTLASQADHDQSPAYYDQLNGDYSILGVPLSPAASPPNEQSGESRPVPEREPASAEIETAPSGVLHLRVNGELASAAEPAIRELAGIRMVTSEREADLTLDGPTGDLRNAQGETIFRFGHSRDPGLYMGVLAKWALVEALAEPAVRSKLHLRLSPPRDSYAEGEAFTLDLQSRSPGIVVLFDIAGDGSVALWSPDPPGPTDAYGNYSLAIGAAAPDGIDHVVGVVEPEENRPLLSLLRAVDGHALSAADERKLASWLMQDADLLALGSFRTVKVRP